MLEYNRFFLKRSPRFPHPLYGEGFKKITVKDLSFSLNQQTIFSKANIEIKKNEVVLIIGENGIGKSTLLKLLNKQIRGFEGEILLDGIDLNYWSNKNIASKIAYLPQKIVFNTPFTVQELLEISSYSGIIDMKTGVPEAIKFFQIEHLKKKKITQLSGGELQRSLLASTYVVGGELMLLDEPFSFLDPGQRKKTYDNLISLHKEQKRTLVVVVNSVEDIKLFKSVKPLKICVIKDNKIVQFNGFDKSFNKVFFDIFQVEINL